MARNVERRLILIRVEPGLVPDAPGEGSIVNLAEPVDEYQDDWTLAGHSLSLQNDGGAVLSLVFERLAG